jgi:hypothetical protein
MPVLPRVVLAAAVVVPLGVLGGCARFDASLGQQQAIVSFQTGATTAQRLVVRDTCGKLPAVTRQAVPNLKKYPYALEQLTFGINKASDAQVANLQKCLNKFPATVAGVTLQDSSDDGG